MTKAEMRRIHALQLQGLGYRRIAAELGLSVNTVRNQISKALNVLKNGAIKIYTLILSLF